MPDYTIVRLRLLPFAEHTSRRGIGSRRNVDLNRGHTIYTIAQLEARDKWKRQNKNKNIRATIDHNELKTCTGTTAARNTVSVLRNPTKSHKQTKTTRNEDGPIASRPDCMQFIYDDSITLQNSFYLCCRRVLIYISCIIYYFFSYQVICSRARSLSFGRLKSLLELDGRLFVRLFSFSHFCLIQISNVIKWFQIKLDLLRLRCG